MMRPDKVKYAVFALLLCIAGLLHAQVEVRLPGYGQQLHELKYGDAIQTVITNTGDRPIALYFRHDTANGGFADAETFVAWLKSGLEDSTEFAAWVTMLRRLARVLKSPAYTNYPEIYRAEHIHGIGERMYSSAGFLLSVHAAKCGEFATFACHMLVAAGVPRDSVRIVSINNGGPGHTIFEIYLGKWTAVDLDRSPFFMFPGPWRYYSTAELVADTNRISTRYFYGPHGQDLAPFTITHAYRQLFANAKIAYQPLPFIQLFEPGTLTLLCPGCTLNYAYAYTGVSLDASTKTGQADMQALRNLVNKGNPEQKEIEQVLRPIAMRNKISLKQCQQALLNENKLNYYNKVWQPIYTDTVPTLTYIIPATRDTQFICREMQAPLLIGHVAGRDARIEVRDTVFGPHTKPTLWAPNGTPVPDVSPNMLQYLAGRGRVMPHNSTLVLTLYANPWNYIDYWNGGTLKFNHSHFKVTQFLNGKPINELTGANAKSP